MKDLHPQYGDMEKLIDVPTLSGKGFRVWGLGSRALGLDFGI